MDTSIINCIIFSLLAIILVLAFLPIKEDKLKCKIHILALSLLAIEIYFTSLIDIRIGYTIFCLLWVLWCGWGLIFWYRQLRKLNLTK